MSQKEMGIYPGYQSQVNNITFRCAKCHVPKTVQGRRRRSPQGLKLGWWCADCIKLNEVKK